MLPDKRRFRAGAIVGRRQNIALQQGVNTLRHVSHEHVGSNVVSIGGVTIGRFDRRGSAQASSYLYSTRKRIFDVSGALTLLVLLAPLLVMVGILIRLTSKGPVFFRQQRCGADMKPFAIVKFRSMYVAPPEDDSVQQASRSDSRITPLGRVLRRTSIDELPQLINVLRNEMSLIGPRPHAVSHDEFYQQHIPAYSARFAARPGLSGLAQVSGARGATPQVSDMERRISLDLEYLEIASLRTDVRLVAATVREMLFSSAAY